MSLEWLLKTRSAQSAVTVLELRSIWRFCRAVLCIVSLLSRGHVCAENIPCRPQLHNFYIPRPCLWRIYLSCRLSFGAGSYLHRPVWTLVPHRQRSRSRSEECERQVDRGTSAGLPETGGMFVRGCRASSGRGFRLKTRRYCISS